MGVKQVLPYWNGSGNQAIRPELAETGETEITEMKEKFLKVRVLPAELLHRTDSYLIF